MKKTLVALAVLAASGASFAQVSLTGGYTFGYAVDTAIGGAKTGGLYTDGASLKVSATEDLGGGLSATASVSAGGFNRGSSVGGEDASLTVAGGFGSIKLTSMESGAGANFANLSGGYGLDGAVFSANTTKDRVYYVLPKFGDVTVQAYYTDYTTATAPTDSSVAGAGGSQGSFKQAATTVAADYAAGALVVGGSYTMYTSVAGGNGDSAVSVKASYDLGVAKLAVALDKANNVNNTGEKAVYGIGASVPMGAVTFGLGYGNNANNDGSAGKAKAGTVVGASYALSKTTSIGASYRTLNNDQSSFRVLASKSF